MVSSSSVWDSVRVVAPTFAEVVEINVEFVVEVELEEAKSSTSMSNPFMPRARSILCCHCVSRSESTKY